MQEKYGSYQYTTATTTFSKLGIILVLLLINLCGANRRNRKSPSYFAFAPEYQKSSETPVDD